LPKGVSWDQVKLAMGHFDNTLIYTHQEMNPPFNDIFGVAWRRIDRNGDWITFGFEMPVEKMLEIYWSGCLGRYISFHMGRIMRKHG